MYASFLVKNRGDEALADGIVTAIPHLIASTSARRCSTGFAVNVCFLAESQGLNLAPGCRSRSRVREGAAETLSSERRGGGREHQLSGSYMNSRSSCAQRQDSAMRRAHSTASSRVGNSSTVKPPLIRLPG